MFDTLTFAELDAQHVELLPARTVLSLISMGNGGGKGHDNNGKAYGKGMSHSVSHTNIINSGNATATSGSATSGNATASGNNINAAVPVNIGGSSGDIHQSAGNTATSGAASSGNATATGGNITVK